MYCERYNSWYSCLNDSKLLIHPLNHQKVKKKEMRCLLLTSMCGRMRFRLGPVILMEWINDVLWPINNYGQFGWMLQKFGLQEIKEIISPIEKRLIMGIPKVGGQHPHHVCPKVEVFSSDLHQSWWLCQTPVNPSKAMGYNPCFI